MDEHTPLRKQLLSIPNMMSYFRVILIPFIVWRYVTAETTWDYCVTVFIIILSALSDVLDGIVARKFNMVTPAGKWIDPIADKLTQLALALSLSFRFPLMYAMLAVFLVKETYMMTMNILLYRKYNKVQGAVKYGKICTAMLYIVMSLLILIPQMPLAIANILIAAGTGFLIYAFIGYARMYVRMWRA